ncbi:MAG: hypothetical protein AAF602_03620 [Myxococcota bacterium]
MDDWTQAIYDATGIPLNEADLTLSFTAGQWTLELHRYAVLPVGADPDPHGAITPSVRGALARAMEQRLSETVPQVRRLVEARDAERARDVTITIVNTEKGRVPFLESPTVERGWPHFLLRLSARGFDVEVDLNPYEPDAPFELDEVQRQVDVILQVARST